VEIGHDGVGLTRQGSRVDDRETTIFAKGLSAKSKVSVPDRRTAVSLNFSPCTVVVHDVLILKSGRTVHMGAANRRSCTVAKLVAW
jgi:hypothetical protein